MCQQKSPPDRPLPDHPGLALRVIGCPERPLALDLVCGQTGETIATIRTYGRGFYASGPGRADGPTRDTVAAAVADALMTLPYREAARSALSEFWHAA